MWQMADAALVQRLRPGDHVCWSFADDLERRRIVTAYVNAGLRDRHKVLFLTHAVDPATAIADLAADGVHTAEATRSGHLQVMSAQDTYLANGGFDADAARQMFLDATQLARRQGYTSLRALGDMGWGARDAPGTDQLPGYERQVNRLYADGYAMAVCMYDRRLFGEPKLSELARAHPATVTPCTSRVSIPLLRMVRRCAGLQLCGEADLSNRDALAAVLTHLVEDAGAGPVITLDVTDLAFADATVCELIVDTARSAGGHVRTVGARPSLRRLLTLQGAADVPGLLDEESAA
jgi:anti-anti-sigma regulatory factor